MKEFKLSNEKTVDVIIDLSMGLSMELIWSILTIMSTLGEAATFAAFDGESNNCPFSGSTLLTAKTDIFWRLPKEKLGLCAAIRELHENQEKFPVITAAVGQLQAAGNATIQGKANILEMCVNAVLAEVKNQKPYILWEKYGDWRREDAFRCFCNGVFYVDSELGTHRIEYPVSDSDLDIVYYDVNGTETWWPFPAATVLHWKESEGKKFLELNALVSQLCEENLLPEVGGRGIKVLDRRTHTEYVFKGYWEKHPLVE